ncbi:hypothetical protein AGLY_010026 [Aphis glycines]|uniref:Uncharacterized protein n=1 Tax=Aphis glycines TaxID=307491 RepID=A0A6G0TGL8_APHGL|nr:hypothetical protein AGLY_010026 [Aphis glycines]
MVSDAMTCNLQLDRESALAYLDKIDRELYRLDARYSEQAIEMSNKDIENPIKFQKNYESDFNDLDGTLTELKEMQQILRDKYTKKSLDLDDEDYNSKRIRKILEAKLRMSDSQYNRLLETLTASSDYTYAQTMMDEIIYQLAKLMFNQGLFIGGSEAQESLQKFTDFLETEASRGRISRALEKKILDLLITSLSDTLTEHPELMAAAKEGFSKYLDAYPNSVIPYILLFARVPIESNVIHQMKNDNISTKTRRDTTPAKVQPHDDLKTAVMKRSVKTSGIEDNPGGSVAAKN